MRDNRRLPGRRRRPDRADPALLEAGRQFLAPRQERPEQHLQRALVDLLDVALLAPAFCFAIPNGGARSPIEAAILEGLGVRAGLPDLAIVHDGSLFWLELKSADGRLSAAQLAMHARLRDAGCEVAVVRSVEEAVRALAAWNIPTRLAGGVG